MRITTTTELDDGVRVVVSGNVVPDPQWEGCALVSEVESTDEDGKPLQVLTSEERRLEEALVEQWARQCREERVA